LPKRYAIAALIATTEAALSGRFSLGGICV
jgi:hypothetical protein